MTKKDLRKYTVIQDCINGIYTVPQAASLLKLSDRQVQRLKKEVILNVQSLSVYMLHIVYIVLLVFISCEQFVNIVRNISFYYWNYNIIIKYICQ